jgi:TPP-dependent pyruvate/acetoin dehydrogenase alpha subunit
MEHISRMMAVEHELEIYRQLLRIRIFEETVLDLYPRGQLHGTTHTYIGQEVNAVSVLAHRTNVDIVVSNHRCHGHYLACGGSMDALAAELMGRETGVCQGRGGSQHLVWENFYANGILGGTVPLAIGMAYAQKVGVERGIVFSFLGDGTLGEGVVYESLNMASLWSLPVLFVVENNRYAQSTPIKLHLAGEISARFAAFDIPAETMEAEEYHSIHTQSGALTEAVRAGDGPRALVLDTYRFAPHSKGDDFRAEEELARYRSRDPVMRMAETLPIEPRTQIEARVQAEVARAFELAEQAPFAHASTLRPSVSGAP